MHIHKQFHCLGISVLIPLAFYFDNLLHKSLCLPAKNFKYVPSLNKISFPTHSLSHSLFPLSVSSSLLVWITISWKYSMNSRYSHCFCPVMNRALQRERGETKCPWRVRDTKKRINCHFILFWNSLQSYILHKQNTSDNVFINIYDRGHQFHLIHNLCQHRRCQCLTW